MHIELIGSTSAGKTTLAKKMADAGRDNGENVSLSDDFILEQLHLGWVKNEFIRRRMVEFIAFGICITCLNKYKGFLKFVVREGRNTPGSWFYKVNRIRNVIRKIGIYEFISRRSGNQQTILADNEGILQGVHNLFVHQKGDVDLKKIAQYVEQIPLPDVILYLRQKEEILISRTLTRGHDRVKNSQDEVIRFIKQAVAAFEEVVRLPRIQERLLIVNSEYSVQNFNQDLESINILRVVELIQSGKSQ